MKRVLLRLRIFIVLFLISLATPPLAQAGTAVFNFDTDPAGLFTMYGTGNWRATEGNPATGGYLSITDAVNSERTTIVFDDFDSGQVVKAFSFSVDVRIGGGTSPPADGFSINYARENDPVVTSTDGNGFAASPTGEGNLPEEGTTTGLAVGFDAWYSGGADVIGISVRLDNTILTNIAYPTQNGDCDDRTSLQTGPQTGPLCWQPFTVNLETNGNLTITYKGGIVVSNFPTAFFPSPGRLVFAGRTGGNNQNTHIDNINITTIPASVAQVGAIVGSPAGFNLDLSDSGASVVDPNTIVLTLNGASITPNAITKNGITTTVRYQRSDPSQFFPAGASNFVTVAFRDTSANPANGERSFIVAPFIVIPASYAVPAGSVDTNQVGFWMRPYQTAENNPNTLVWTEDQLLGLHGTNLADLTNATNGVPGLATTGFVERDTVINFSAGGNAGNFTTGTGFPDEALPGIPGLNPPSPTDRTMNSTEEVYTWLYLPAGYYTMGVNSDDGFKVTTANNPYDRFALHLGQFDTGRGASDTLFSFVVNQAGYYPFRLLWENGGGGADLEWFTVNVDGTKILINNTNNTNAVLAYRGGPPLPGYVSSSTPAPYVTGGQPTLTTNVNGARPDVLRVDLTDGATTISSATLRVNGAGTSTSVRNGAVTTVRLDMPPLMAAGPNTATLVYTDSAGRTVTNNWGFTVQNYVNLDPSVSTPLGSGDANQPGFNIRVHQVDQVGNVALANLISRAEQQLAGIIGPNVANLTDATNSGYFISSNGWINMSQTVGAADIGNFRFNTVPARDDEAIPGIPGLGTPAHATDSIAAEFLTYVEFPTPGIYTLGVNSDDGFKTTTTETPPINNGALVLTPASGPSVTNHAVSAGTDGGGGMGRPITNVISGRLVLADPAEACVALLNAAAIAGNIAVIDRGTCTFTVKLQNALAAGAIGVIVLNNRDPANADGTFPIVMTGTAVDIPAVMISMQDGNSLKTSLVAGVVNASITPDLTPALGQFNTGRGASDTQFTINVPMAGLYPIRTVWFEGDSDANIEIFSVDLTGTRVLINDTNIPTALKSFRARSTVILPRISSITQANGSVTVIWTGGGTLYSSPSLFPTASWTTTGDSDGVFTEAATGTSKYYRVVR